NEADQQPAGEAPAKSRWKKVLLLFFAFVGVLVVIAVFIIVGSRPKTLTRLPLGDGRILQIEGVTYGTNHRIGSDSVFKRVAAWIPAGLQRYIGLERRANDVTLDHPGMVVWVNAVSEKYLTNVDCQGIRMEFVDKNGDLFGEETSSWFG